VVCRRPEGKAEDEGWLFCFVGDIKTKRGSLHMIDATDFRGTPTAVIHIPGLVPAGVHGSWIDDSEIRV
jgi:8'-apo-carotenoid 13,14-cleaving dioxygenase